MAPHSLFDPLLPVLHAAQNVGPTAWGSIIQIEIAFSSGVKIPLVLASTHGQATGFSPDEFDPSANQIRILTYLALGPKSPKQLKMQIGRHLYDDPGGLDELMREGWILKKLGKLKLSEIGEKIVVELGDEEESET